MSNEEVVTSEDESSDDEDFPSSAEGVRKKVARLFKEMDFYPVGQMTERRDSITLFVWNNFRSIELVEIVLRAHHIDNSVDSRFTHEIVDTTARILLVTDERNEQYKSFHRALRKATLRKLSTDVSVLILGLLLCFTYAMERGVLLDEDEMAQVDFVTEAEHPERFIAFVLDYIKSEIDSPAETLPLIWQYRLGGEDSQRG